ncbi:uroporphyrinogen-III synthase [Luteibacter sp. UNCMF331Sha3.1]|uniref:uroporphyrinogen-III synthase n=1 Tax=Luteibacter sp. UNCMF331Sha3.1 TaxID=1502760 RepID=UPI0008D10DEF|nr:uroporphyrinogen-III synthase [Luteibacter sp. UNCMF331Sha3.1]SEN43376.1 uroporphyrinogen-III synthase [Luteibacter sp. UNCMF331Sha3.1]
MSRSLPLRNVTVVITRPAGTAGPLARRVRKLGGIPVSVPGLSLRATEDATAVGVSLRRALEGDVVVFTSPAAVRFAADVLPLATRATVIAVGRGTARALKTADVTDVRFPETSQDSEGVLGLAELADVVGKRVALVGAPGGRGLLREALAARGATLDEIHVYHRVAPRIDRRHIDPLLKLGRRSAVLLSSAEALDHLRRALVAPAWRRLVQAVAVVSSERMRSAALDAGFERVAVARSALPTDLLTAAAGVSFTRR